MRHLYRCPLRWSDMDVFGHVNNVVFLRYLEEARVDLMFRLAREEHPEAFSGGAVVARHEIDYLRPLLHRHRPVTVETWVTKIGAASLSLSYEIKDDEVDGAAGGEAGDGLAGAPGPRRGRPADRLRTGRHRGRSVRPGTAAPAQAHRAGEVLPGGVRR